MAFLTGQDFGVRLIEALGLQHQNVRSITLHCVVNDAVRVTIEHYLTEEQGDAVADLLAASGGGIEVETVPLPDGGPYYVHYDRNGYARETVNGDRQAAESIAYHLARRHAVENSVTLTDHDGVRLAVWYPDGMRTARDTASDPWHEGRWRAEA